MLRRPSAQVERLATLTVAGIFVVAGAAIVGLLTSGSGVRKPSDDAEPGGTAVALTTFAPSLDRTARPTTSVTPATEPPTADPGLPTATPPPATPNPTPQPPASVPPASPSVQPTPWLDITRVSGSFGETLQIGGVSVYLNTRAPTTDPLIRCDYEAYVSAGYTELVSYDMVVAWTVPINESFPTIVVGTTPPGFGGWFEGPVPFQNGIAYVASFCKVPADPNVATVMLGPFQNQVPLIEWHFTFH
jgi:hypothetical protein